MTHWPRHISPWATPSSTLTGNWNGAEKEYRRALDLDPNSAVAHCLTLASSTLWDDLTRALKSKKSNSNSIPTWAARRSLLSFLSNHRSNVNGDLWQHTLLHEHYWNLGLMLWKTGRLKEANEVWQDWMISLGYTDLAHSMSRGYEKTVIPALYANGQSQGRRQQSRDTWQGS